MIDLAGSTRAFQSEDDVKIATVLQRYYEHCDRVITSKGGTVLKFIGDGCLAVFSPEHAAGAIEAVHELQETIGALSAKHQVPLELGANLHIAMAIEADFGAGLSRRRDILGRGVLGPVERGRAGSNTSRRRCTTSAIRTRSTAVSARIGVQTPHAGEWGRGGCLDVPQMHLSFQSEGHILLRKAGGPND